MRTIVAFARVVTGLFVVAAPLLSQDRFPVTQLTSDSTREGFPTWSPDGTTILYSYFNMVDGKPVLGSCTIPSVGGTPVPFTDFPTEHPQWSPDGRWIVFDADTGASVRMIGAQGGTPVNFLPESLGIHNGGLPCWSPDGSHIAFKEGTTGALWVYDTGTRAVARIFHQEGMLAIPGCWSRDGRSILIALMDRASRVSTLWQISADGGDRQQITGHHEGFHRYIALSPDGSLLVYAALEAKRLGLWVMNAGGGTSLPLTVSSRDHQESPAWSPDGTRLAFSSSRTGHGDIYIMEVDTATIKAELAALNR